VISSLRGEVTAVTLSSAVIETGGVGLLFNATPNTLSTLQVGAQAKVYTYLVVKEDSLTLYGFATTDERDTFATLMGAKGVGAKLALAMLAVHTPDALRQAIAAKDTAALTRVPGLGPKGAQRVILDVGDKLGPLRGEGELEFDLPAATDEANPQVVAALVGLGWNEAAATGAVLQVTTAQNATDVSALLRAALRNLGAAKRV